MHARRDLAWLLLTLLVVPAALLAGCTGQPTTPSTFASTCPAWRTGLSTNVFREEFHQNSTEVPPRIDQLASGLTMDDGKPLDKVLLDFTDRIGPNGREDQGVLTEDSLLEVRAFRNDDGKALLFYDPSRGPRGERNQGVPVWTFGPDAFEDDLQLYIDLADPTMPASPSTVRLEWTWMRDLDGDADTRTRALLFYTASYLYRTC